MATGKTSVRIIVTTGKRTQKNKSGESDRQVISELQASQSKPIREIELETAARPAAWKILLAFAIIYFVWGSTFLAIRVGVHEVPPFLLAAIRFFVAGIVLYG